MRKLLSVSLVALAMVAAPAYATETTPVKDAQPARAAVTTADQAPLVARRASLSELSLRADTRPAAPAEDAAQSMRQGSFLWIAAAVAVGVIVAALVL